MSQPPPPPAGSVPPPPLGSAPPPPLTSRPGAVNTGTFGILAKTKEQESAEHKEARAALRKLAASPELLAVAGSFTLLLAISTRFEVLYMVMGLVLFSLFSWIFLTNGDAIVAGILLVGISLMGVTFLVGIVELDQDSILWFLPGLLFVFCEAAVSYNHFRRRRGQISVRIGQTMMQNLAAVLATTIVLSVLLRALLGIEFRISWPWFATTVIMISLAIIAALVTIRKNSAPADRRRFNPGRRMIPPPR